MSMHVYMKVRGFATGCPAERSGKIKVRFGVCMCVCVCMYV